MNKAAVAAPRAASRRKPPSENKRLLQAEATRQKIVDSALELFARQGLAATRTRHIAEAAGISEGLLFHHFLSKTALLMHIAHNQPSLAQPLAQMLRGAADRHASDVLMEIGHRFVGFINADRREIWFFMMLLVESQSSDESYGAFKKQVDDLLGALQNYLNARVAAGELREDLDSNGAARMLIGSFVFFFMSNRHLPPDERQAAATRFATTTIRLLCDGMTTQALGNTG